MFDAVNWEKFVEKHVYKNPDVSEKPYLHQNLESLQDMVDKLVSEGELQPFESKSSLKDWSLKKQTAKESPLLESKTVLGITIGQSISHFPEELYIRTAEDLDIGIPIQIQLEIFPTVPIGKSKDGTCYHAVVSNMKARVKPGTTAFTVSEEKQIDHIINGTEEEAQQKKREIKRLQKCKEKEEDPNRFTGLEI